MSNTTKVQAPIQQNNKDVINNYKNKNIYYNHKQNFKPSYANYEQRQYPSGFFDQFYANLPSEK